MSYIGDFPLGATLDTKFSTYAGAPIVLGGSPVISIYKDNDTTQTSTGVTLSVDFDSVVGLNNLRIDLSSDGTFYSAGSNFQAVITTGTVGGVSAVGTVVCEFSINARSALRPTTAGRTLDVATTGEAGLDFDNIKDATGAHTLTNITVPIVTTAATATNLTNAPTNGDFTAAMKTSLNAATPASVTGAVGSVTGSVGSVVGAVVALTGGVGGNVAGSVASVVAGVTVTTNNDKTGYSLAAGQLFIKKNTQILISFPMTDDVNHLPVTGLSVSAQRSIDGAAVGNCANSVNEISDGLYSIVLAAADTNGAMISYIFSAANADTRFIGVVTQP